MALASDSGALQRARRMLGAGPGGEISTGMPVRPASHAPGAATAAVGAFPRDRTARFTGADILYSI
jgi:hypothetical protein